MNFQSFPVTPLNLSTVSIVSSPSVVSAASPNLRQQSPPRQVSPRRQSPRRGLLPGWAEKVDPGSGKPYWVNTTSKQISWKMPVNEATSPRRGGHPEYNSANPRIYELLQTLDSGKELEKISANYKAEQEQDENLLKVKDVLERQNFVRNTAKELPDATEQLERYAKEPAPQIRASEDSHLDPTIEKMGLAMFVDGYKPPRAMPDLKNADKIMTIAEADKILQKFDAFMQTELLGGQWPARQIQAETRKEGSSAQFASINPQSRKRPTSPQFKSRPPAQNKPASPGRRPATSSRPPAPVPTAEDFLSMGYSLGDAAAEQDSPYIKPYVPAPEPVPASRPEDSDRPAPTTENPQIPPSAEAEMPPPADFATMQNVAPAGLGGEGDSESDMMMM